MKDDTIYSLSWYLPPPPPTGGMFWNFIIPVSLYKILGNVFKNNFNHARF
jgi:hypothetical protein